MAKHTLDQHVVYRGTVYHAGTEYEMDDEMVKSLRERKLTPEAKPAQSESAPAPMHVEDAEASKKAKKG